MEFSDFLCEGVILGRIFAYAVTVMCVRKYFPLVGAAVIFSFGAVLHMSFLLSERAAWSYIVSSVNFSAWELYKPFAYSYIFFIIVELSYLRPTLLGFLSAKLIGMYVLCGAILAGAMLCRFIPTNMFITRLAAAAAGIILAQAVGYRLYAAHFKTDYFIIPLLASLCAMIFLLLMLSFYPPHWGIFYDFYSGGFGRYV